MQVQDSLEGYLDYIYMLSHSNHSKKSYQSGVYPTHVSTTLTQLSKKNLVVCLTPKLKKGRLYELTKKGNEIILQL